MNEQTVIGAGRELAGTVEFKVGAAIDSDALKADGLIDRAGGLLQHGYGAAAEVTSDTLAAAPAAAARIADRGREWARRADMAVRENLPDNRLLYALAGLIGILGLGVFAYSRSRSDAVRASSRRSRSRRPTSNKSARRRRKVAAIA